MSMVHSGQKLRDRLFRRSQMDPNGGCWLWEGYLQNGYGRLDVGGKKHLAHRASYVAFKGQTSGLSVMHKCDVPACVNPDHLTLGTHADNMADMAAKGRASRKGSDRGERHAGSKLTEDMIRAIRSSTDSSYRLANTLAVTPSLIRQIRRREAWSHVE